MSKEWQKHKRTDTRERWPRKAEELQEELLRACQAYVSCLPGERKTFTHVLKGVEKGGAVENFSSSRVTFHFDDELHVAVVFPTVWFRCQPFLCSIPLLSSAHQRCRVPDLLLLLLCNT